MFRCKTAVLFIVIFSPSIAKNETIEEKEASRQQLEDLTKHKAVVLEEIKSVEKEKDDQIKKLNLELDEVLFRIDLLSKTLQKEQTALLDWNVLGIPLKAPSKGLSLLAEPEKGSRLLHQIPEQEMFFADKHWYQKPFLKALHDNQVGYVECEHISMSKEELLQFDKKIILELPQLWIVTPLEKVAPFILNMKADIENEKKMKRDDNSYFIKSLGEIRDGEITSGKELFKIIANQPSYRIWVATGFVRTEQMIDYNKYIYDKEKRVLTVLGRTQIPKMFDEFRWTIFHDITPDQFRNGVPYNNQGIKVSLSPFVNAQKAFPLRYPEYPEIVEWP